MKKIPTLFEREFKNHKVVGIKPIVTKGFEWVLNGEGIATVKYDGSCCAIIDGKFYKRYDCKKGKTPPNGAIPCCDPDPVTGHWPHWIEVDANNPADKWFISAFDNYQKHHFDMKIVCAATYEAIGPHFQGNPYNLEEDTLIKHGINRVILDDLSFEGIEKWLTENEEEGLVFWKDGKPQCKIKRVDFGLEWPVKNGVK